MSAGGARYVSVPAPARDGKSPFFAPKSRYYLASFHVHALADAVDPAQLLDGILAELPGLRARICGAPPDDSAPSLVRASPPQAVTIPTLMERGTLVFATAAWVAPRLDSGREPGLLAPPRPNGSAQLPEPGHPLEHDLVVLSFDRGAWGRFLVFGVGTRFTDRDGILHDHPTALEPELLAMLGNLRLLTPRA